MSEQQAAEAGSEQTPPEGSEPQETKTFDAEYVDKLRKEAAKYRTEAKANSEAAKRLAAIEEANQTEAEKAAKRVAELEAELNNTRRDGMRLQIASAHGITDADDIELFLTGSDEETLTRQAKRLAAREADRQKTGNRVPREGHSTVNPGDADRRAFVRNLTGRDS